MCGCFGNICTCIYCVFVLFRLYKCLFITSIRTTAPSANSNAVNNNNNNNNITNNIFVFSAATLHMYTLFIRHLQKDPAVQ